MSIIPSNQLPDPIIPDVVPYKKPPRKKAKVEKQKKYKAPAPAKVTLSIDDLIKHQPPIGDIFDAIMQEPPDMGGRKAEPPKTKRTEMQRPPSNPRPSFREFAAGMAVDSLLEDPVIELPR